MAANLISSTILTIPELCLFPSSSMGILIRPGIEPWSSFLALNSCWFHKWDHQIPPVIDKLNEYALWKKYIYNDMLLSWIFYSLTSDITGNAIFFNHYPGVIKRPLGSFFSKQLPSRFWEWEGYYLSYSNSDDRYGLLHKVFKIIGWNEIMQWNGLHWGRQ